MLNGSDETAALSPADSITVLCCVESGWLEPMTLLLFESLRRWGGAFAGCPVLAVTPRFGPALSRSTLLGLERLGVEYLRVTQRDRHGWYSFFNKPIAARAAEQRAKTPLVLWLDSDVLVMSEPRELLLGPEEDFAACASDKGIGTAGPEDPRDPYWRKVAEVFGMDPDRFPKVLTQEQQDKGWIRVYWNSGVFVWRRSTGFAGHYLEDCRRLLESRVASSVAGIYFNDQVALGISMLKAGLRWRPLSYAYNYALGSQTRHLLDGAKLRTAHLLHYHDALWPTTWDESMKALKQHRPEIHDWLAQRGPLRQRLAWHRRALNKCLKIWRERKSNAYEAHCTRY